MIGAPTKAHPAKPDSPALVVVGGGTAGLPAVIAAAERGCSVTLIEKTDTLGGTLPMARELSAAGTAAQRANGIDDSPSQHLQEVLRLAKGKASAPLAKRAVDQAAETVSWLEKLGVRWDPETPKIVFNHEAYELPRTVWATGGGAEIRDRLVERVQALQTNGRVRVRFRTSLKSIVRQGTHVTAIRVVDKDGDEQLVRASQFLIATGGYTANASLYQRLHDIPQRLAWAPKHAQGDGLVALRDIGAKVWGCDALNLSFGAVMDDDGPMRGILCRLNTLPDLRQPWEIIVNSAGKRFFREDEPSVDRQEQALLQQADQRAFMVFDNSIRANAPDRIRKWYGEPAREDFSEHRWFYRGATVEALADAAGIDAAGLAATIEEYNAIQSGQQCDPFGRHHLPSKIIDPPFYAIRFEGCNVIGSVGIQADESLRCVDATGQPLQNLYLAGEILGAAQLMGASAAGGMMATPALTFGRLVGLQVAAETELSTAKPTLSSAN